MEKSKYEYEGNYMIYTINANGNDKEKQLYGRMRHEMETFAELIADGTAQNRPIDQMIVRATYGSSTGAGGVEEALNLDGELVENIVAAYNQGKGDSDRRGSIVNALTDDKFTKFIGFKLDTDHHPPLRYVVNVPYLKDGKELSIKLELPCNETHYDVLNDLGLPADIIEYHREMSAGFKSSGNFTFDLTVPSTRNTASPTRERFYKLPFETTIGTTKHPRGTIVSFDLDDENKPLDKLIADVNAGTNNVRFYKSELDAANQFHERYAKPSAGEHAAFNKLDMIEQAYNYFAKDRANQGLKPADYQKKLQMYLDKAFGDGLYKSLSPDGNLTPDAFNKKRAEIIAKRSSRNQEAAPIISITYDAGAEKVKVKETTKNSSANLTLIDPSNNKAMSLEDIKKLSDEELAKLYENAKLKSSKETVEIATVIKAKGINKNPADGERYIPIKGIKPAMTPTNNKSNGKTVQGLSFSYDPVSVAKPTFTTTLPNYNMNVDSRMQKALSTLELMGVDFGGSLEISSAYKSIDANLNEYSNDYFNLENAPHMRGLAVDIPTYDGSNPSNYNTPGYRFAQFLVTAKGKKYLQDNNLRAWHRSTRNGTVIQLEYNTNPFDGGSRFKESTGYKPTQ